MARKRWEQRIAEAEARGSFTDEDRRLARNWVTCACGEQDPRIPRRGPKSGQPAEPSDIVLAYAGARFYAHGVRVNDFGAARKNLQEIETRAAQLLYYPPELFHVVQELLDQQAPVIGLVC